VIERITYLSRARNALIHSPVVSLLGPRQVGKTTLARQLASGRRATLFDLEVPADLARLSAPMLTLEPLRGLVVIDEVQRLPKLFEVLRVLADRPRRPAKFLILGSVDPRLVRGVSESLAGRVNHFRSTHAPGRAEEKALAPEDAASKVAHAGGLGCQRRWARQEGPPGVAARRASPSPESDSSEGLAHGQLGRLPGGIGPGIAKAMRSRPRRVSAPDELNKCRTGRTRRWPDAMSGRTIARWNARPTTPRRSCASRPGSTVAVSRPQP